MANILVFTVPTKVNTVSCRFSGISVEHKSFEADLLEEIFAQRPDSARIFLCQNFNEFKWEFAALERPIDLFVVNDQKISGLCLHSLLQQPGPVNALYGQAPVIHLVPFGENYGRALPQTAYQISLAQSQKAPSGHLSCELTEEGRKLFEEAVGKALPVPQGAKKELFVDPMPPHGMEGHIDQTGLLRPGRPVTSGAELAAAGAKVLRDFLVPG